MFRKCDVIILPHDVAYVGMLFINNLPSEGSLGLINNGEQLYNLIRGRSSGRNTFFHMYVLSEEDEIEDGDYCVYNNGLNSPGYVVVACKVKEGIVYRSPIETWENYGNKDGGITPLKKDIKKIIATTDFNLNLDDKYRSEFDALFNFKNIPLPPKSCINNFIKSYNGENKKFKINVEYYSYFDAKIGDKIRVTKDVHLCPKDSFITIKSFNHNYCSTLIEFEEDNKHNQGIQSCFLDIKTKWAPCFDFKTNSIITRNIRDNWNRNEVEKLMNIAYDEGINRTLSQQKGEPYIGFEEFLEQNLL